MPSDTWGGIRKTARTVIRIALARKCGLDEFFMIAVARFSGFAALVWLDLAIVCSSIVDFGKASGSSCCPVVDI